MAEPSATGKKKICCPISLGFQRLVFTDQFLLPGHQPLRCQQGGRHKHVGKINLLGRAVAQEMPQQRAGKRHDGDRHQEQQVQPHQRNLQMPDEMHCQMVHYPEQSTIKKRNKKAKESRRFVANLSSNWLVLADLGRSGTFSSSTSSVMAMAKMPSVSASMRPLESKML